MQREFLDGGPEIYNGQNPTEMPVLKLGRYDSGSETITAACTGPDEGLTGIKRSKLHLSASYADDIDFIDTQQENEDSYGVRKSTPSVPSISSATRLSNKFARPTAGSRRQSNVDQSTSTTGTAPGTVGGAGMRSRKNSKHSISSAGPAASADAGGKATTIVVSMVSNGSSPAQDQNNKNLLNAKTELSTTATGGANLERERLLREAVSNQNSTTSTTTTTISALSTPVAGVQNWQMDCDFAYGISVSLYENNMLTKEPMGNPIADCYGCVVRGNAAAMAMADGVNWGKRASSVNILYNTLILTQFPTYRRWSTFSCSISSAWLLGLSGSRCVRTSAGMPGYHHAGSICQFIAQSLGGTRLYT